MKTLTVINFYFKYRFFTMYVYVFLNSTKNVFKYRWFSLLRLLSKWSWSDDERRFGERRYC